MGDDDLEAVLQSALALLAEGAAEPGSIWRTPTLASIGLDGAPQLRTIVLRRFDAASRCAHIHADRRSAKLAELHARPQASLHGWDSARRVQLRASGPVSLHTGGDLADADWAALRPSSRATYAVEPGPGTTLDHPAALHDRDENAAREKFCVIRLHIARLEWLLLEQGSYRRARFAWDNGARTAMWLVP